MSNIFVVNMKVWGIFLFILSLSAFSQSTKHYIKAGKKAYNNANYALAVYYFGKALEQEQNAKLAWYMAEAARLNHDFEIAEKWYSYVDKNSNDKYPLAPFWMAMVQKDQAKYQRAQINFKKYLQKHASAKDYYTLKARHEVLSCENALFLTFNKSHDTILSFDSTINSPYSEFQAYLTLDSIFWLSSYKPLLGEDSLNFTSKLLTFKKDSTTLIPLPIDSVLNAKNRFVSSFAFMNKNRTMVISLCNKKIGSNYVCRLYKSNKNNTNWSAPELLKTPINLENASSTHPFVVETDTIRYLLFASDREGGYGKYDLWAVAIDTLVQPIDSVFNLGKNINSIDHELSPFYDVKHKTLYFSSEWFTNLGGLDIFYSYGWLKNLSPPQNIGYPINTNHNEIFYQIAQDSSMALFASNRTLNAVNNNEKCCNDIFYIPLNKQKSDSTLLSQTIEKKQKEAKELIPLTLYFHNDEPNPRSYDTTTTFTYSQLYEKYILMRDEYIKAYAAKLKNDEKLNAEASIDAFFTEEVEKNYLKLLNFLQVLKQLLINGQTITITIKGYASPLNNHAYNLNLSKRRIQSLINMLYSFEDGFFVPYLEGKAKNGAKLNIIREAFGENMVTQGISDDPRDQRNSVYSPDASKERKIAVIAITF
ncbi:MAG: tetratricopeptide repeat protein [Bacteroidales bacterium]